MSRLAKRPYQPGDPLPDVGALCMVSGVNQDISCDQDRFYSERRVIGYTPCGNFVCLQTVDCWPTVEKLSNCWFAPARRKAWFVISSENPVCGRNGYAYIYDAQPTDPTKIGGIGNRVEACIEIEYTPGDGLRGEPK